MLLTTQIEEGAATSAAATSVPWWSFTKTVLAIAALRLAEQGKLSLETAAPQGPFTLRQLLGHKAGVAEYGQYKSYHDAVTAGGLPWSHQKLLQETEATRLRFEPGTGWAYSNIGYLYVRQIIEDVTGTDLAQALRTLVLHPLELPTARLATVPQDLIDVEMGDATGYHPGWVYHGLLVGPLQEAGLLLYRLMMGNLLPPELMAAMQQRHALGPLMAGRPWTSPGYALGLMIGQVEGGATVCGHSGGGPGSAISVYFSRDSGRPLVGAAFATGTDVLKVDTEATRIAVTAAP
jgi:CubicO group peptidase (beta-lactamase class C family)